MTNLYFQICALFVSSLLVVIFFSKKRLKSVETKLFSGLLITSFVDSILMFLIIYIAYVKPESKLLFILNKLDFIQYLFWASFFFLYFYNITFRIEKKKPSIMPKITLFINIIVSIIMFIAPINLYNENNVMYASGVAVNILYVVCALYFIATIISVLFNIKRVKGRKFIPLFALIILGLILFVVRSVNPGLLIIPAILAYIDLIMIFTIENPDVKMIFELNKNKKLLESMSEEKSNFLFSMSQDTKKPIENILEVKKMLENEKDLKTIETGLKVIENNARGLKNIINNVLDISSISSNKLVVYNETYNIYSLLNTVINGVKSKVSDSVSLRTNISENIPTELYGDSVKLKQVITSILYNAAKFTKEGYIELSANEIVKYDVCRLIIEVEDSGRGMSVEKLNELLKSNSDLEDTDLLKLNKLDVDLKLAFKLIRKLGGFINIKSEEGKGSTFTIVIDQKIKQEKDPFYSKYIFNKKKVIAVSDSMQTLKMMNSLANKYDVDFLTTMHGNDLVQRVEDGEVFDLIILEDEMKPSSALSILGKLEEAKKGFNVPTVVMLNKNKESIKEHYLKDGFDDYLRKENMEQEFDRIIKKYV